MIKEQKIYDYCLALYNEVYDQTLEQLTQKMVNVSTKHNVSDEDIIKLEKSAQLIAIKSAIKQGRIVYPDDIPTLWASIYKAHLFRKSGIKDLTIIQNVVSADQSWKASSGHAFEELVKELGTLAMEGTTIQFILQRDLNVLLKANEIANDPRDVSWLREKIKGQVFDLYVVADKEVVDDYGEKSIKKVCFGCVQCKTSIRDRVSRDIVPSREAMDSFFWSIGIVLDGSLLRTPKCTNMINGNPNSEFKKNGWHGFYDLSSSKSNGRLYGVDVNFDIIREHTLRAYKEWSDNRQWFNLDWCATK